MDEHPRKAPRRLHLTYRKFRASPEGTPGFAIGVRVGYWPCMKAPFLQLSVGFGRVEIFHGQDGYKGKSDADASELLRDATRTLQHALEAKGRHSETLDG